PLPWNTASEREFGRQATHTGMPSVSRPVILPRRVIPMRAARGRTRASVSSGATVRWVPRRKTLSAPSAGLIAACTVSSPGIAQLAVQIRRAAYIVGIAAAADRRERGLEGGKRSGAVTAIAPQRREIDRRAQLQRRCGLPPRRV